MSVATDYETFSAVACAAREALESALESAQKRYQWSAFCPKCRCEFYLRPLCPQCGRNSRAATEVWRVHTDKYQGRFTI